MLQIRGGLRGLQRQIPASGARGANSPATLLAVRTPLRTTLSQLVGWLADRRVPRPLRGPLYRGYARATGADLHESRGPLTIYPSLGAFFVRRLVDGARPIDGDPERLVSPVDGRLQAVGLVGAGSLLQAKGHRYPVRELLAGVGADLELEGACAWTLYLGPADYHRIHAPESGRLVEARWVGGGRHSVAPKVLARRAVLATNERCVLRLETDRGPILMVLVGAWNVGRIRVVGVEPGWDGPLPKPAKFARGEELARFELGSTVILITPPGVAQSTLGDETLGRVRLGRAVGRFL